MPFAFALGDQHRPTGGSEGPSLKTQPAVPSSCSSLGREEINSSSEDQVPFKYWTGTLVLDIYGKGSQTPGRVEIELTSADEGVEGVGRAHLRLSAT